MGDISKDNCRLCSRQRSICRPISINEHLYGKLNGEYKEWWNDGQIRIQTNYVNGIRNGEYKSWWPNGHIYIQCTYIKGEFHGEYKTWYRDGELLEDKVYIEGIGVSLN